MADNLQMRALILCMMPLVAAGCATAASGPPPRMHHASPGDFDFANRSESPCVWGRNRRPDPAYAERCKEFSEAQYYHGVWRVEFEMSNFTFQGRTPCFGKTGDHESCIDLTGEALPWPGRWDCSREFEVEFVGRRSLFAVPVPLGISGYQVKVDRLISAKRLPDPYDENCDPELHPELKVKK